MSAASNASASQAGFECRPVTLLELVTAISEVTDDEGEIVATVAHLLRSGRVRLKGNFRGAALDELF